MMECILKISLSTLVDELEGLCETIVDFDNLKKNGFDFSGDVATQGWEVHFNSLKGPVYPALVKVLGTYRSYRSSCLFQCFGLEDSNI